MNKPEMVKGAIAFDRKTLQKTALVLFDNDTFQVTCKTLDRDTLKVTVVTSHYTIPSMQAIVGIYMKEFADTQECVVEDWQKKSDIEG